MDSEDEDIVICETVILAEEETVSHPSSQPLIESKSAKNRKRRRRKKKNSSQTNPEELETLEVINSFKQALNLNLKNDKQRQTKKSTPQKSETFPDYLSAEEIEEGIKNGSIITGDIRINPRKFTEAFVSDPDDGKDIIIVGMLERNRALEGDIVALQIKPIHEWIKQSNGVFQRTGVVVGLLNKVHNRVCVGTLSNMDSNFCRLSPRDSRFPRLMIPKTIIPSQICDNLDHYQETLFKGVLVCWDRVQHAQGVVQAEIGIKGDLQTETDAIMMELGLDRKPLPESLHKFLPSFDITDDDIASRLDLRDECIFSIDPETARDLDDAVSINVISEDEYEVGVHISDVSHYLYESTPLDIAVSNRATTVYLVHKVFHMLPEKLTMACSLLPGQDKLAFSVIWRMTPEGEILATKFSKTIIRSAAQLSYDHAQDIIEGKEVNWPTIHGKHTEDHIKDSVLKLYSMTKHMTKRRFDGGALKIDQMKAGFRLNENLEPISVNIYQIKDSNRLIEELMLAANTSVAEHLDSVYPRLAFLRRHPPPKVEMKSRLDKAMKQLGVITEADEISTTLHSAIQKYAQQDLNKFTVLNLLYSKPMMRAIYFCDYPDKSHYALNIELYTHFTSPIRRYADIIVHRQLAAALDIKPFSSNWTVDNISKLAEKCNQKKYAAKKAGDLSCELFVSLYVRRCGHCITQGIVYAVYSHSFDIILTEFAYNIRVYADKLEAEVDFIEAEGLGSILRIGWKKYPEQIIKVFDQVTVRLEPGSSTRLIEAFLVQS